MHGEFLTLATPRWRRARATSSASAELPEKGFQPLTFRYLALTAHYRSKLDFTDEAMHAAASGLARLRRAPQADATSRWTSSAEPMARYRARFAEAVADDLAKPARWPSRTRWHRPPDLTDAQRRALLLDFDRVLGLDLDAPAQKGAPFPEGAAELLDARAAARAARDFAGSDELRDELAAIGVEVRDTPDGQVTEVRSS